MNTSTALNIILALSLLVLSYKIALKDEIQETKITSIENS